MKLLVNQAYDQMGLPVTQLVGTLLDGAARHTPYGQERPVRPRGGARGPRRRAVVALAGCGSGPTDEEQVRTTLT